jgi:hypothetical protein
MATPLAIRYAKLSGAIDKAFGEHFTFVARKVSAGDVNLPAVADTNRPNFTATGVWDGPAKAGFPRARGAQQDDNTHQWSASMPSVCVHDDAMPWKPTRDDITIRLFDGATYLIADALPDGMGRTVFKLTAKKR